MTPTYRVLPMMRVTDVAIHLDSETDPRITHWVLYGYYAGGIQTFLGQATNREVMGHAYRAVSGHPLLPIGLEVHPWKYDDDPDVNSDTASIVQCEPDDPELEGWGLYRRVGNPALLQHISDHETREQAESAAFHPDLLS